MTDRPPVLTDALIERALARRATHGADAGLLGAITAAAARTPQRRSWWPIPAVLRPNARPTFALVALAVAVAMIGVGLAGGFNGPAPGPGGHPPTSAPSPTVAPSTAAPGSLLAASNSGIIAIDPASGSKRLFLKCQALCVQSGAIAASPDGTSIAYGANVNVNGYSDAIWIVDVATGRSHELMACPPDACQGYPSIRSLSWSPDGQLLAFDWGQGVWTVGLDGQPPVLLASNASDASFSADGTEVMYVASGASGAADVWVANVDGTKAHTLPFHDVSSAAWSPDGARIAYVTFGPNPACGPCIGDAPIAQLTVADLNGQQVRQVHALPGCCHAAFIGPPVWSPDGRWLAWAGGTGTDKLVIVAADGSSARSVSYDYAPVVPTWLQGGAGGGP